VLVDKLNMINYELHMPSRHFKAVWYAYTSQ